MTRTWPEDWDARKRGAGCWFCGNQIGEPFYAGTAGDAHLERREDHYLGNPNLSIHPNSTDKSNV